MMKLSWCKIVGNLEKACYKILIKAYNIYSNFNKSFKSSALVNIFQRRVAHLYLAKYLSQYDGDNLQPK